SIFSFQWLRVRPPAALNIIAYVDYMTSAAPKSLVAAIINGMRGPFGTPGTPGARSASGTPGARGIPGARGAFGTLGLPGLGLFALLALSQCAAEGPHGR